MGPHRSISCLQSPVFGRLEVLGDLHSCVGRHKHDDQGDDADHQHAHENTEEAPGLCLLLLQVCSAMSHSDHAAIATSKDPQDN